jgi:hypothetical protein
LDLRREAAAQAPGDKDLQNRSETAIAYWAGLLALADPQIHFQKNLSQNFEGCTLPILRMRASWPS